MAAPQRELRPTVTNRGASSLQAPFFYEVRQTAHFDTKLLYINTNQHAPSYALSTHLTGTTTIYIRARKGAHTS